MARVRISELPQLTSGSINTILVGDDNGVTYQIPLNTLTQSVVNMLSSSIDGRLDILEANASTYLTSLDGAITSSQQIEDLGFITSSGIDTSIFATTGSNIFNGNQTISGSVGINANSGSWNFAQNGTLTLPNGSNIYGNNLLQIDAIGGFQLNSYTNEFGSGSQVWAFNIDGTLNVPGIVGFGKACEICMLEMESDTDRISKLRDKLEIALLELEEAYVNGSRTSRLPHVANISFKHVEGEGLLMGFNKNIALSSGSACTSASLEPSYVLKALGLGDDLAHSSLRFGLSRFTTDEEIDYTIKSITDTVLKLREMSPLWEMYKEGIDLDSIEWAAH